MSSFAFKFCMASASLVLAASTAHAQSARSNFYVEGGVGLGHANGDYAQQVRDSVASSTLHKFASASYDHTGSAGGRVALGWRALPALSAEVGYTEFGRFDTRASVTRILSPATIDIIDGRFRVSAVTLDAVGHWSLSNQITATARLGVGFTEQKYRQTRYVANQSDSESHHFPSNRQTRLHWGIGGQYALNANTAVVANYERVENVGNNFSNASIDKGVRAGTFSYGLLSVGLRYTF